MLLSFQGDNRDERRAATVELFPKEEIEYELKESPKFANILFPVMDKGKKDIEHWPEIREEFTKIGADIYNKIKEADV